MSASKTILKCKYEIESITAYLYSSAFCWQPIFNCFENKGPDHAFKSHFQYKQNILKWRTIRKCQVGREYLFNSTFASVGVWSYMVRLDNNYRKCAYIAPTCYFYLQYFNVQCIIISFVSSKKKKKIVTIHWSQCQRRRRQSRVRAHIYYNNCVV